MKILFRKFKFSKYKIFNYCLSSSKKKFLQIYIPEKNNLILSGNASLNKYFNFKIKKKLLVKNINTQFFLNEKIKRNEIIDFIKIDVEGSEIDILKGLKKIINHQKPIIYVEVWKNNFNSFVKLIKNHHSFLIKKKSYYRLVRRRSLLC